MSKYLHVDGDDGSIRVEEGRIYSFVDGWVYKVPNNYTIHLKVEDMGNNLYIYELLDADPVAELVYKET